MASNATPVAWATAAPWWVNPTWAPGERLDEGLTRQARPGHYRGRLGDYTVELVVLGGPPGSGPNALTVTGPGPGDAKPCRWHWKCQGSSVIEVANTLGIELGIVGGSRLNPLGLMVEDAIVNDDGFSIPSDDE